MRERYQRYYSAFSGWIANLGVVPLLLLAAFLFFPILDFLFALLFLVTRVFETIFQLLSTITISGCKIFQINKIHNLRTFPFLVKKELRLLLLFFMAINSPYGLSSENQGLIHTLAIGELIKVSASDLLKFTIGNAETARVKALPSEKSLLIKGSGLGQTDLLLWFKGKKEPIKHQIFVVQKSRYLRLKSLSQRVQKTGLKAQISGDRVMIRGVLKTRDDYRLLIQIRKKYSEEMDLHRVSLSSNLRLEVYGNFLTSLQDYDLIDLDCQLKRIFISCRGSQAIKKGLKNLEEDFLMTWPPEELLSLGKQYQITLTIQQFENSQGEAFDLGLSSIEGNIGELLIENPLSIIHKNTLQLQNSEFKSQTLAHPKLRGRLKRPIKVRLGQEIPFLQSVAQGVATQDWRFAGLGLDLNLIPHTERLILRFKTNLSRPGEQGINQNSQESEVLIELGKTQVLFDIGFRMNQESHKRLPFLSHIPIFGSLFSGKNAGETYKKILCLVLVEEI